jgi:hypothetical protein
VVWREMSATGGHHAKWSKPGSETQKTHFLSYMEGRSKDKHIQKQAW